MVSDPTDKEDLAQEVFVKVFRKLGSFRAESKLSTWIAQIAFNTTVNFVQKKKPALLGDITDDDDASLDSFAADLSEPDDRAVRTDMGDRIREEIDQLPVQYGLIVTLYHLEEMSYKEIGEILSLPDGTVKSHLFRGRKLLKERLLNKYSQEDLCA
jgi:RNA polymerase sigma-70 factor (ECF subfamily)